MGCKLHRLHSSCYSLGRKAIAEAQKKRWAALKAVKQ